MQTQNFVFFFGHSVQCKYPFLSQWYASRFVDPEIVDDNKQPVRFENGEQYMMYSKAVLFHDWESAKKILNLTDPKMIKAVGRRVCNFDEHTWEQHRSAIVHRANYLKFTQNPVLREKLLAFPKNTVFVEASPYDRIWGIGYSAHHAMANQNNWGLNLLGQAISRVRNDM